jgi:hypothetical protein
MVQPCDEALAARKGQDRRVGHGAVYARAERYSLASGSTAPTALPVSFTAPTAVSTARLAPVAATLAAAPAIVTTAHPQSKVTKAAAQSVVARRTKVKVLLDIRRPLGASVAIAPDFLVISISTTEELH